MEKRIKELDFFRAISAILIILYHYTTRYNDIYGHVKKPYMFNLPFGCMAISVFFILSGFLTILAICNKEMSMKQFLYKRFIRLWPSFVTCMILTTAVIYLAGDEFRNRLCSIKDIILNLTMMPSYFGAKAVDGAYWTLGIEIIFYFFIAFILLLKKQKQITKIAFAGLITVIIFNIVSIYCNIKIFKYIRILFITDYIHMFICGIALYYLYLDKKSVLNYVIIILCSINQIILGSIENVIFFITVVLLFYILVILKTKIFIILDNKLIKFISKISYQLYLLHQFIGYVIINKMEEKGFTNEIYIIIPITISIILAYLVNKYVENPTTKLLNKKTYKNEKNIQ